MPNPYFQLRHVVRRLAVEWSRRESRRRLRRLSGRASARTCHWHVLSELRSSALPFDSPLHHTKKPQKRLFHGVDGSRTRVQKPIHRTSTIIVHLLGFPLPDSDRRLSGFGSFILRTHAQSFAHAVSCLFDAGYPRDRYPGPTAAKP